MKRSWVPLVVSISGLLLLWQCGARGERETPPTPAPAAAIAGPPSSVTGPVIFRTSSGERIFVVDFPVTLKGGSEARRAKTDIAGRYRFLDVPPGRYTVCWEAAGWTSGCTNEVEVRADESAYPKGSELKPLNPNSVAWGTVRLADGSTPALIDRATNAATVPSIEVLDASGKTLATGRTNADGQYAIGVSGAVARVRTAVGGTRGERALAAAAPGADRRIVLDNQRPVVTGVALRKGGADVTRVSPGDVVTLHPSVSDPDGDTPSYAWTAAAGTITTAADGSATWQLPRYPARLRAYLTVTDGNGGAVRRTVSLSSGGANAKVSTTTGPPTCTPLSLSAVPPPSGYPPTPPFLTFLNTGTDNSAAYYTNVDPKQLRTTLGAWWTNAGFSATDGSGGVAQAAYLNWNDLGFGRDMHFNQVGNNVYAWVTNYGCPDNDAGNADLAANPVAADAVATVCMEYAPVEGSTTPVVKFFVYVGGVAASARTGTADLDEWGGKFVPNLCQICHGGSAPYSGGTNVNLGSSFIPFDLALLRYPKGATTPPAADLPAYYKMNTIIAGSTKPSGAIVKLINGWYTPLNSPPTQNNAYVPAGWTAGGSVPSTAAGLYANVVVPGCRTCHYSLSPSINWDTYSSFQGDQSFIQSYVCDTGPVMPHAAVTYVNFWTNAYGFTTSPPQYLGAYTDSNWTSFGGCTGK
ncbi:MAG TPA: carboxypeptidase-like regulatory domain-containing protein [Thermoanaerobaculia bacterium]|nr:carboxypeptidase-like regulatory domain-containing protein [Thermoanaerobaculia bacterium]